MQYFRCFDVFKVLHQLTNTLEDLETITKDVIHEFDQDNVVYLELRTTPKSLSETVTKQQYIETVLETIRYFVFI